MFWLFVIVPVSVIVMGILFVFWCIKNNWGDKL